MQTNDERGWTHALDRHETPAIPAPFDFLVAPAAALSADALERLDGPRDGGGLDAHGQAQIIRLPERDPGHHHAPRLAQPLGEEVVGHASIL